MSAMVTVRAYTLIVAGSLLGGVVVHLILRVTS